MNERILALDVGDARIGIAVSDPTRTIAQPVEVLHRKGWGPDSRRIKELCDGYETTQVLSGLPLNMDGTEGGQAKKVREFCALLENLGLTVYYHDERLTTVTAENALISGNMHRSDRRNTVDKVAAVVILQSWLDAEKTRAEQPDETEERPMSEQENNIIELVDEDGETVQFEHLATLEHEGEYYIALMLLDEDHKEEDDEGEVVIMKIAKDESEQECYEYVDDEDLQQVIFEKFLQLMEEQDEFVDAEDPEDEDKE